MLLLLFCWGQDALKQKNLPLGGFSGLYMASLLGPFSLTKRAPKEILFARISFSFQKAPDDTGISSAAALDQQALPAGHPPPFEKGGRKLYFFATFLSTAAKREVFSLLTFFFYQATCQVKCNSKLEKISEGEFQLRHLRGR